MAAAIDYEQLPSPLHGSITRQIQASILRKRRQNLKLEPRPPTLDLPGTLDPKAVEERELEGGVVLVGRASLKEYFEGLRRGWLGGVDGWEWEKEVEEKLKGDGVFEGNEEEEVRPDQSEFPPDQAESADGSTIPSGLPTISPPVSSLPSGLSFLSRPPLPLPSLSNSANSTTPAAIPSSYRIPPNPLPPQPPLLLLPFVNHLGIKQFPYVIYDFFTERHRVRTGAEAALALILGPTRPLERTELDFGRDTEKWYTKSFAKLPERIETARKDYYSALEPRLQAVRDLANGERELSDAEKKSSKPLVTEENLREERRKRELRWFGNMDGYEIVRKENEVAWDDRFEGWLRVFEPPHEGWGR